jgi:adenylate cyclase
MPSRAITPEAIQRLRAAAEAALRGATGGAPALLGERRDVTVLSVQIALEAPRDAGDEEEHVWIDEALRLILTVIHRYAGVVDTITAAGALALFGLPVIHEDDARRAAQAALAFQVALAPLAERLRQRDWGKLLLQTGLHSGPVIVGAAGAAEADYSAIGDTVRRAVELQRLAPPGGVLASAATVERLRASNRGHAPTIAPSPAIARAFELRPPALQQPAGAAMGPATVMIGREAELGGLLRALDEAVALRQSRVALVSGESGIGKSRLVAAFRAAIAGRPLAVYQVGGAPGTRAAPLLVVGELLRALVGLRRSGARDLQRERHDALARLGLDAAHLRPFLEPLLGAGVPGYASDERLRAFDPAMLQRQTHLALRQAILSAVAAGPAVLIVEDLHWLDLASRDFLEYLLQATREQQPSGWLLLLVTRDAGPGTLVEPLAAAAAADPGRLLELPLAPLSADEARALVAQLLAHPYDQTSNLLERLAARAAGNPLFIEELVRSFVERGALALDAGLWRPAPLAEEVLRTIPETLQGLVVSRFSRLPERLRRLLQRAAVLGRSFPRSLLLQLEGGRAAALPAEIDELVGRHVLLAEPWGGEPGYTFTQALLQEAVYRTLLLNDRQRLHGQVAELVEADSRHAPDERARLLAYHYAESATPFRALPHLISSAEAHARRSSNAAAIEQFRRARELMAAGAEHTPADLVRVRIGLGRVYKFAGRYAEAAAALQDAVADLEAGAGPALPEALCELGEVYQRDGDLDRAVATLERALALPGPAEGQLPPGMRRALLDRLAAVRFRQGDLAAAYELATAATAGAEQEGTDDLTTLASLYNILGGIMWQRGDLAGASRNVEQSLRLYQQVGYSWGMATAYTNLGILAYTQGLWPRAVEQFQRSDLLRKEIGFVPERAVNLKNLGVVQMEMGDHDQAIATLTTGLAISRQIGDDYGIVITSLQLADLALLLRRPAEARNLVEQARALLPAAGEDEAILADWLAALIAAAEGRLEAGLRSAEAALALAQSVGVPDLESDCLRVLGAISARRGDFQRAEQELMASLQLSAEQQSPYRQGLAHYELGWLYRRQAEHDGAAGAECFRRAREQFAAAAARFAPLPARYDLRRAQAALLALGDEDASPL